MQCHANLCTVGKVTLRWLWQINNPKLTAPHVARTPLRPHSYPGIYRLRAGNQLCISFFEQGTVWQNRRQWNIAMGSSEIETFCRRKDSFRITTAQHDSLDWATSHITVVAFRFGSATSASLLGSDYSFDPGEERMNYTLNPLGYPIWLPTVQCTSIVCDTASIPQLTLARL